jgi:hypothetical protein
MRYLAECPRCHTRLSRTAYLSWGIDRECRGCHGRLKENKRYRCGWSAVVFGLVLLAVVSVGVLNRTNGTIVSSDHTREYLLHVPGSYDRAKPTHCRMGT